jgi:hypothetical protein
MSIPVEITADIGTLLEELSRRGIHTVGALYSSESFGNYYVDLGRPGRPLSLVRDRFEYRVEGPSRELLESAELLRGFKDRHEFSAAVLRWLVAPGA